MRHPSLVLPLLLPTFVFVASCATVARPPGSASGSPATPAELDLRATLLQLADRRELIRIPIDQALLGGPALRVELAVALGRIGDPLARPMLEGLLRDVAPEVRRAAAFGLGELGEKAAVASLSAAATDVDREVGALAVEALGKLEAPLAELRPRLAALGEPEASFRLLPQLFRFRQTEAVEAGIEGLSRKETELRLAAAYGLARYPQPASLPILRSLLTDPEARIRALAARGLGEVGEAEDLARLLPFAGDPDPGVEIHSMRSAARLGARFDGRSEVGPEGDREWSRALISRLADSRPGVRLTALESAVAFVPDPGLEADAERIFESPITPRDRELALAVLAASGVARGRLAALEAAAESSPELRAAAATAAGKLAEEDLLEVLAGDSAARVRLAVLEARFALAGRAPAASEERGAVLARAALADADATVRATALDWLVEHPLLPVDELAAVARAGRRGELEDDRLSATLALGARARQRPHEREVAVASLERLSRDESFLVRRAAARALRELGEIPPPPSPMVTGRDLRAYREILQQTATSRRVELLTSRGRLVLELACPEAPLTCLSFLQLAASGYFDGLTFHRVVPDFVVQGGDPRGDGWGGPGYALRDEINRRRYRRGAVGMALSGPDTGGSQFFVTLSPQPHLDGGYTVFGQVVEGDEVLDRIVQGDRIEKVTELAPARDKAPARQRR